MTVPIDVARQLRDRVARDVLAARRDRDAVRVGACQAVLGAIDNAGAVPAEQRYDHAQPGLGATEVPRRQVEHDELVLLLQREVQERRELAGHLRGAGRTDDAAERDAAAAIIEGYLDDLAGLGDAAGSAGLADLGDLGPSER